MYTHAIRRSATAAVAASAAAAAQLVFGLPTRPDGSAHRAGQGVVRLDAANVLDDVRSKAPQKRK
ncbi:MAG: hypothetical protein C5B57_11805 [Blastocatellia bacterium]|nr:MAG: hypothetical protein C5B57_11805 [Blastocatellia bacterium]